MFIIIIDCFSYDQNILKILFDISSMRCYHFFHQDVCVNDFGESGRLFRCRKAAAQNLKKRSDHLSVFELYNNGPTPVPLFYFH